MRLIDADALIGMLHKHAFLEGDDRAIAYNIIEKQPTVYEWINIKDRLPEQKRGHWILDPNGMDWNLPAWVCSECHGRNNNLPLMDDVNEHNVYRWAGSQYCPCCGAKMNEEVEQDD